MSNDIYTDAAAQLDGELSHLDERVTTLENDERDEIDYERLAEEVAPHLDGESGGGGVDQGDLDDIRDRIDRILLALDGTLGAINDQLATPIGPTTPSGEYHTPSGWGMVFDVHTPLTFATATIDSMEEGVVEAVLGRYDRNDHFEVVDRASIPVEEGVNEGVGLDLVAPTKGTYLLTRDDDLPLRRASWDGWGDEGVLCTPIEGSKPGDWEAKPNTNWYYFFNLHVENYHTSEATHILGPSVPPTFDEGGENEHSTEGWGLHFAVDTSFTIGEVLYRANQSGAFNAELYNYENGEVGELVDATEIEVPVGDDTLEADLDLSAPAGEYLLTRDYTSMPSDRVALVKSDNYSGFAYDSRGAVTCYGSAHNAFSSNENWYNFYDIHLTIDEE